MIIDINMAAFFVRLTSYQFSFYFCSVFGNEGQDGRVSVPFSALVRGYMRSDDIRGDPALTSVHSSFIYHPLGRRTAEVHCPSLRHLPLPIEPGMDQECWWSSDCSCAQFDLSSVRHTAVGMGPVDAGAHLGLAHLARSEWGAGWGGAGTFCTGLWCSSRSKMILFKQLQSEDDI